MVNLDSFTELGAAYLYLGNSVVDVGLELSHHSLGSETATKFVLTTKKQLQISNSNTSDNYQCNNNNNNNNNNNSNSNSNNNSNKPAFTQDIHVTVHFVWEAANAFLKTRCVHSQSECDKPCT